MKNLLVIAALCVVGLLASEANAQYRPARIAQPIETAFNHSLATKGDVWAKQFANNSPWHREYYYLPYGAPTALVVPPNVMMQQNYSWGVSQNTMTPVYHQYGSTPGSGGGGGFLATPRWPSHTRQFGVYPVRAPW